MDRPTLDPKSVRAKECVCSNCKRELSLQDLELGYSMLCGDCFDREVSIVLAREVKTQTPKKVVLKGMKKG